MVLSHLVKALKMLRESISRPVVRSVGLVVAVTESCANSVPQRFEDTGMEHSIPVAMIENPKSHFE